MPEQSKVLAVVPLKNGEDVQVREHEDGRVRIWVPGHRAIVYAMVTGQGSELVFGPEKE